MALVRCNPDKIVAKLSTTGSNFLSETRTPPTNTSAGARDPVPCRSDLPGRLSNTALSRECRVSFQVSRQPLPTGLFPHFILVLGCTDCSAFSGCNRAFRSQKLRSDFLMKASTVSATSDCHSASGETCGVPDKQVEGPGENWLPSPVLVAEETCFRGAKY